MSVLDEMNGLTNGRSSILRSLGSGQPVAPVARELVDRQSVSNMGEFQKGLRRFGYNAAATSRATLGQFAEPFAPEFAGRQFDAANSIARSQPANLAPEIDSFRKVDDLRSAVSYASGSLGQGLPSVATVIAGSLLGRGAGAAARLSQAGRNAAQVAGGTAAMFPMEAGETALTLRNNPEAMANTTPAERLALSAGRGTVSAVMESLVPNAVFTNAIAGTARRIAPGVGSAVGNIGRKSAAGVVGEGATEAAQEFTAQAAENYAVPGTGYDTERMLEAAVQGAITGGVLGGAGGTVQAARSNIDAAAERAVEAAGNVDTRDILNRTVERIDAVVRNPEEFGADLANTTLGSLVDAQERAAELGRNIEDQAGPAVASGLDAITAMRQRLDVGIAKRLTPENVGKYAELTKNFRLLSGDEYKMLTDALNSNDADTINRTVGTVARTLTRRVPRETMAGLKSIADWSKKFGAGVTRAARERKASVATYTPADVNDFADFLADQYPTVLEAVENTPASSTEIMQRLMYYRDSAEELTPEIRETFSNLTKRNIASVLVRAREWSGRGLRPEGEIDDTAAGGNTARIADAGERFFTADIQAQLESEGVDLSRSGVTFAEDGSVYDANGNPMDPEEVTNTPFASRELIQRIQSPQRYIDASRQTDDLARVDPETSVPVTYESADGRVTPAQIARIFGVNDLVKNEDGSYSTQRRDPTEEEYNERIKGNTVRSFISPMALAANTGKEAQPDNPEQGGFKEAFSRFVPDFEQGQRDVGVQGYRTLSALASLNNDGIELAPDQIPQDMWAELGITKNSDPIKIKANIDPNAVDGRTIVQRKYINGKKKDITLDMLLGRNQSLSGLPAQLELLESLAGSKNVSSELNKLVAQDDVTATATLKGLKLFARKNKLSPNPAVPGYMEQLDKRIQDKDRKRRFSAARTELKTAYKLDYITPDQMEELRSYKSGMYLADGPQQANESLDELAEYLQSDLEVDWQTDEELVEMLDEFIDQGMWEVDKTDDDFNEAPEGPTPDEQFETFRRSPEGQETSRRVEGRDITERNDAADRANTPLTVQHIDRLEALPKELQTAYWRTQVNRLPAQERPNTPVEELTKEEQMALPFFDAGFEHEGVPYIDLRHAWESFGRPDAEKGDIGEFNQQQYTNYIRRREIEAAEPSNKFVGPSDPLASSQRIYEAPQGAEPRTQPEIAPEGETVPARKARALRTQSAEMRARRREYFQEPQATNPIVANAEVTAVPSAAAQKMEAVNEQLRAAVTRDDIEAVAREIMDGEPVGTRIAITRAMNAEIKRRYNQPSPTEQGSLTQSGEPNVIRTALAEQQKRNEISSLEKEQAQLVKDLDKLTRRRYIGKPDSTKDDLLTMLAKMGGLSTEVADDYDITGYGNFRGRARPVQKKGRSLDGVREVLKEQQWPSDMWETDGALAETIASVMDPDVYLYNPNSKISDRFDELSEGIELYNREIERIERGEETDVVPTEDTAEVAEPSNDEQNVPDEPPWQAAEVTPPAAPTPEQNAAPEPAPTLDGIEALTAEIQAATTVPGVGRAMRKAETAEQRAALAGVANARIAEIRNRKAAPPPRRPAQDAPRQSVQQQPFNEQNPPPMEGTTSEPPTATNVPEQTQEQEPPATPPPTEPPSEPPSGGQTPPPNNEARDEFVATVKRLLGDRVRVIFDQDLPKGVSATYENRFGLDLEDTGKALKEIRDNRAKDVRALKLRRNATPEDIAAERVDPRTPEEIEAAIASYEQQEQEYLADVAVRGTIRVAAGMEAQAGLAEHEALHGAFSFFFGQDNAQDRKIITTAFTRGVLARRLQNYFKDNAEVLAVIDPTSPDFNAEEAAAYAFQVHIHDPGALQMGAKVEGIFNKMLQYLQKLVGYKTYAERAETIFNDLNSGRRAERGVSALRDNANIDESMRGRAQDFVRGVGSGFMHMYDTVLSSSYDRLEGSGNVAMAQIARLGYNETGQDGSGMIQRQRLATTQFSNRMKDALHALEPQELTQLNEDMIMGRESTGKLKDAQRKLKKLLSDAHNYQTEAGVDMGFLEDYYPMIWNPEKVLADQQGFLDMLNQYPQELASMQATANDVLERITSYESRGHEFQGVFGKDGEPVADSSLRRSLGFIDAKDRMRFMEEDIVTTMAHYLNQSVRHAEYVRAYGANGQRLNRLLSEITSTYGGTKQDETLARDYIDGLMGNKEVGMSRELKDLYGAMAVYQNVRLLPLSVFSSLVDPLGISVRTGSGAAAFDTFTYSVKNIFTDFRDSWDQEQWAKFAADMGTIDMSGTVKSIDKIYTGVTLRGKTRTINDGFFKYNLLNGWVKNNHIMATKHAQLFLQRSAEGMIHGEERSAQDLREVGVEPSDIVYDEALGRIRATAHEILGYEDVGQMELQASEDEIKGAREQAERIQQAIHKIVRQSLIQPSSAEMPNWMSNPYLAPIAHLKTFVFGFNATILQRLMYEAQRGNYSPIYYAAAYVPGMIAADFVKGLAGNGGEEPEWKKNWGMGDYLEYGVQRSGLLGTGQFFADMGNDINRGGGGWESLAGPSIEQAQDLVGAMSAPTSQPTKTWIMDAMPVNALYDQWVMD